MYVCMDCGKLFDEPKIIKEPNEFGTPYETFAACPHCGGNFTTAHICTICGDYITDNYIKLDNGNRVCNNCYLNYELGEED